MRRITGTEGKRDTAVTSVLTPPETDGGYDEAGLSQPELEELGLLGADMLPAFLDQFLEEREAHLIAVRRFIHSHPELSGQETGTAELVARELREAGLKPRLLPGGNGVMCDIGMGDRVIALRADMDALPLTDTKNVPYRSTVDGVCHACGHDVHTATLLGAGLALAQLAERGDLHGRVRLIFQPSEEQIFHPKGDGKYVGAPEMIAAGCLKDVSAIFAMHCNPQIPVGQVAVRPGPFTAAADTVEVRLSGPGGHTARPHLTVDLAHALGRVLVDVPAKLDRKLDPRNRVSMVFGAVGAGEAANTIPSEGWARATVRTLSVEAWRILPELVEELVNDAIAGTGATPLVKYARGVPPVVNDSLATAVIGRAAAAALGGDNVTEAEVSMGGEDFACYQEHVPGAMIRLGVSNANSTEGIDIHQSNFDVDEAAISCGVRVFVHTALDAIDEYAG
jgi:amidohydrolase